MIPATRSAPIRSIQAAFLLCTLMAVLAASPLLAFASPKAGGSQVWSFQTGNTVTSSPAIANGVVYIGSDDSNVYALNAATGKKIWSFKTGDQVLSSPAVDSLIAIGSNDDFVYALNP